MSSDTGPLQNSKHVQRGEDGGSLFNYWSHQCPNDIAKESVLYSQEISIAM